MSRSVKIISLSILFFLGLILLSSKIIKPDKGLISPFPLSFLPTSNLKLLAEASFKDFDGKYSLVIKNLKTGESARINETEVLGSASLYKLWVMAIIYDKISKGEMQEDDQIEGDVADINRKFDIDEEDAELTEGHLQYTVKSAIEQMITISHNYAALLLLTKSGNSQINEFVKNLGLTNSRMTVPPKTTASDIALFYELLYKHQLINPETSQKMIEILKKQQLNDRLGKYLPEGTVFAHKTGNLDLTENDAGIVYSSSGDYIIVVLTESDAPLEAREKMAELSKAVFEYFNK